MAGLETPDSHTDFVLSYESVAGQRIYLRPNTKLIMRNPTWWVQL